MRLSDLKPGQTGLITKVLGHGAFRKRAMEMGFVRGREVNVVLNAPLQDPVKYALMGYEVSLRRAEADLIEIETLEQWKNAALEDADSDNSEERSGGFKAPQRQNDQCRPYR